MLASMWLGVLVSTIVFLAFRATEELEKTALGWGRAREN
jgi:hypothetical protein